MYANLPTALPRCAGPTMQEGFWEEELGQPDRSLLLPFAGRVSLLTGVAALGFSPACQLTKGVRWYLQHCPQRTRIPSLKPWNLAPTRPPCGWQPLTKTSTKQKPKDKLLRGGRPFYMGGLKRKEKMKNENTDKPKCTGNGQTITSLGLESD